jgi:hypothetical protein
MGHLGGNQHREQVRWAHSVHFGDTHKSLHRYRPLAAFVRSDDGRLEFAAGERFNI